VSITGGLGGAGAESRSWQAAVHVPSSPRIKDADERVGRSRYFDVTGTPWRLDR
jgi:hypothetical protein